jgi:hypothetical protein
MKGVPAFRQGMLLLSWARMCHKRLPLEVRVYADSVVDSEPAVVDHSGQTRWADLTKG